MVFRCYGAHFIDIFSTCHFHGFACLYLEKSWCYNTILFWLLYTQFINSFSWCIEQVSLVALSFWCFHFASVCAFALLAYVGYVIYAFPSLFRLHRLNGLLLVFILLWAVSTYIFNVAFTFLNWKIGKVVLFSGWTRLCLIYRKWLELTISITYSEHGHMGVGWLVALSHTWILFACTILSWNIGCIG